MLFSSHFYTRLTAAGAVNGEVGWENVKGWTKKKPPLDPSVVFTSCNEAIWP